jgi:type VI secretion system protein ImpH
MTAPVTYGWQSETSLAQWLQEEPFRFEFHQAIRILEAISARLSSAPSESEPPVRFHSHVSFAFPASEVHSIAAAPGQAPQVTVNFMSLAGALGPLPYAYTEMVLQAAAQRDFAAADFLDIFNHRLIWLFYRARKIHHPALTVSAPYRGQPAQFLFSLIGLGPKPLRNRLAIPDSALLHYSGLLSRNVRTASGLECILADYFGLPVRLRQFAGGWREIHGPQQTALGIRGKNQTLGDGAVLGSRVWDQSSGVIVEIGPLELDPFKSLLPGEPAHRALAELARFYLGATCNIQVRLLLHSARVPKTILGKSKLGYISWLGRPKHHGAAAAINFQVTH